MIDDETREAKLKLEDVKTTDEGEYKCEITFLDITKDCPVVQLVKLTTLGKRRIPKSSQEKIFLSSTGWREDISSITWDTS